MVHISFHAAVSGTSISFVERMLADEIGKSNAGATIYLCTTGGESAGASSLHFFIRALPFPVHIHAMGICGSGGNAILLSGTTRSCAPGTQFMLHGSRAGDGSLAPQVNVARAIYRQMLGWEDDLLDRYFSDVEEKWFGDDQALKYGLVTEIEHRSFPANEKLHVVPG